LDPIDESKEIIPKVNGGVGDDEGADTVLDEFVPGKDNIDLGKSENRGKWIGWGVENETFDRGALECRRAGIGGGAKVNIGKEEGGGVPKMKGGSRDSWPQIIEKKSRVGYEEVIDVNGQTFSAAGRAFQAAQPTLCAIDAEIGKVSSKKRWPEADRDRFDSQG
jgi:hypothetical protein